MYQQHYRRVESHLIHWNTPSWSGSLKILPYSMVISTNILDDDNQDNKIYDKYDKQEQLLTERSFKRCTMMSVMAVRCLCSRCPLSLWSLTEYIISEAASELTDLQNIITVHRMTPSHTVFFTFLWCCTMSILIHTGEQERYQ